MSIASLRMLLRCGAADGERKEEQPTKRGSMHAAVTATPHHSPSPTPPFMDPYISWHILIGLFPCSVLLIRLAEWLAE
jgi:hypothetical protein